MKLKAIKAISLLILLLVSLSSVLVNGALENPNANTGSSGLPNPNLNGNINGLSNNKVNTVDSGFQSGYNDRVEVGLIERPIMGAPSQLPLPPVVTVSNYPNWVSTTNLQITWGAFDRNQDASTLDIIVQYKAVADSVWTTLVSGTHGSFPQLPDTNGVMAAHLFNMASLAEGQYQVRVIAMDAIPNYPGATQGFTTVATSQPFLFNIAPSVAFTAPTLNQVFSTRMVPVSWTMSDHTGSVSVVDVEYKYDGQPWVDINLPLPFTGTTFDFDTLGLPNANDYRIKLIVQDDEGTQVEVISDYFELRKALSPTVTFTSPIAGATVSGNVALSWDMADVDQLESTLNAVVEYSVFGSGVWTQIGSVTGTETLTWNTATVADNRYELRVIVTDVDGQQAYAGIFDPSYVTVSNTANLPPVVVITAPTPGVYTGTVGLSWTMNDPEGGVVSVTDVSYVYDGQPFVSLPVGSSDTSYSLDTMGLPNANDYRIRVTVVDSLGAVTTVTSSNFEVRNLLVPTVTLLSPVSGALLDDSVTIAWDMADADQTESTLVAVVQYRQVGSSTWTTISTVVGQESAVWDTSALVDGQYELRVVVTDDDLQQAYAGIFSPSFVNLNNGNTQSESSPVPFRYDTIRMFSANTGSEFFSAGDVMSFTLRFENTFDEDIEDVKVTAVIPELGVRRTVGPFDIDQGDTESRSMFLEIPGNAESGEYVIKVTISDGENTRVRYRTLIVN